MDSFLWWAFLCFICTSSEGVPSSTTLTSNLDTVYPGLTKHLEVTCRFPDTQTAGVSSLVSLVLSRIETVSENQNDLASVNSFDPSTIHKTVDLSADVNWSIAERHDSFLSLHWMYPNSSEVGYYECEANALDKVGHPIRMIAGSVVRAMTPDLKSVAERFRQLQQSLSEFRSKFDDTTSDLFISSQELTYMNSRYLLSNFKFEDVDKAQSYCNWAGGHLVEINSEIELGILQTFLSKALTKPLATNVLIGLSDEKTEGSWLYLQSQELAQFFNWAKGEPNTAASNCAVVLENGTDLFFYDFKCRNVDDNVPFLCEITS